MLRQLTIGAVILALAGCVSAPVDLSEVPRQERSALGDRVYRFVSGCVIVVEPRQAVIKVETGACQSHHRDIALLYAAGD